MAAQPYVQDVQDATGMAIPIETIIITTQRTSETLSSSESIQRSFYQAFSHPPNPLVGHEPDWQTLYSKVDNIKEGRFQYCSRFVGDVESPEGSGNFVETNEFEIAFTTMGNKGIPVIFLHGVPSNRRSYYSLQRRMGRFCRTLSFDMLGLGESSKPRNFGKNFPKMFNDAGKGKGPSPWDWNFDLEYVELLIKTMFPGEKVVFVADDWGGGILAHAAVKLQSLLHSVIFIDPIAGDSYPVSEIQAIGRASQIKDDAEFAKAMGSADQTFVQIFKTMVYDQSVYNQYNLKDMKFPYIDTDYERSRSGPKGEDATSLTMRLKMTALRVLADRSAILSPALLLPYDKELNPKGVDYTAITIPVLVLWSSKDSMMSERAMYRFLWGIPNAPVSIIQMANSGHFLVQDQPDKAGEAIMNFIIREHGRDSVADIFLGFGDRGSGGHNVIWKGDEQEMIDDLRQIYNKDVKSLDRFL